jgi:hypothetical protein
MAILVPSSAVTYSDELRDQRPEIDFIILVPLATFPREAAPQP